MTNSDQMEAFVENFSDQILSNVRFWYHLGPLVKLTPECEKKAERLLEIIDIERQLCEHLRTAEKMLMTVKDL